MEKTIQITLNQEEANNELRSIEELQESIAVGFVDDTDKIRDLSILWDKVFAACGDQDLVVEVGGGFGERK